MGKIASTPSLTLKILSLRYSSWSMRPWLALTHAGLEFASETVALPHMMDPSLTTKAPSLEERRKLGSVRGLFPVLQVGSSSDSHSSKEEEEATWIHESLAICEYVADVCPEAQLWPESTLDKARARALCCEMMTGFMGLRNECSCALFARVPEFHPKPETQVDVDRVMEIWIDCLRRSGGPYLFGKHFGIVDAMFYPVLTRFRTYGIALQDQVVEEYAATVESTTAVIKLVELAKAEPNLPLYDDYILKLGGDPAKAL